MKKNSALKNSLNGINVAIEKEHNLLYIMIYIIVVLALSFIFPVNLYEVLILVVTFGITLSLELVNTAIESVTDLACKKENELAKIAKDSAGASLFIMIMICIVSNVIIFLPKILESFGLI